MSHSLTLWRAAQLSGVPRGELKERIREGKLAISDGLIRSEDLLALYPQTRLEESGMLEKVTQIKSESFGRRVRERMLPSQEVLAQRLFGQTQELADVRRLLQHYHQLVINVQKQLRQSLAERPHEDLRTLEQALTRGLSQALATEAVDEMTVMNEMLKVVSARVVVRPSGHEFTVEGHDTLLQAGLRAGLKLNYGCGNGSCGLCKCRVVSGEVVSIQPHDYTFSEAEKLQGYTLLCAHTAGSSELMIETLEAAGPQDLPEQQILARVRSLKPVSADLLLLHLQTPRTNRLRFLAGQSVTLGVAGAARDARRTYPVASCPCDDRNLHFYVARDDADALAGELFAGHVKNGDAVTLWGPVGDFVLQDSTRQMVFVACDLGIAPIKSLIEHAVSIDATPALSLFWLSTRKDGHFLANQCRAWSDAIDPFEYSLFSAADPASGAVQVKDSMRADLIEVACDYYLCGPEDFLAPLLQQLRAAGIADTQIRYQVI